MYKTQIPSLFKLQQTSNHRITSRAQNDIIDRCPRYFSWFVDDIAIREFKNIEKLGVPYPKDQPMRIYSSLWNAEDWATQHGLVKTNWSLAPFTASYRNYSLDGCVWSRLTRTSSCSDVDFSTKAVLTTELDERSRARMKRLQRNHMVYDYCKDRWRFPKGPARECRHNQFYYVFL